MISSFEACYSSNRSILMRSNISTWRPPKLAPPSSRETRCRRGLGALAANAKEQGRGDILASTRDYRDLIVDCLAFNQALMKNPEDVQQIVNASSRRSIMQKPIPRKRAK